MTKWGFSASCINWNLFAAGSDFNKSKMKIGDDEGKFSHLGGFEVDRLSIST